MMLENVIWAEKFRPTTVDECFLPPETKKYVNDIISSGDVPHLLLVGPPGIGKTTLALALANELGYETMKVNSSLNGGIDNLRVDIQQFASTISLNGKRKAVILDEADGLSHATQTAFRGFIDEFGANVLFIFTANFKNKIIEPLQASRLTTINVLFNKVEKVELAKGLFVFLKRCLDENSVKYDVKAIQKFIIDRINLTSDIRKIINDAQKIATSGIFDLESIVDQFDGKFDEVVDAIKGRNFNKMRQWVGENSDIDATFLYRHLYDNLKVLNLDNNQILAVISIINEHQYKHAFVADREINLVSCLAEISSVL